MVIETLESRQLLSAYFIDAARGNDALSGRSARTAWQTLSSVSSHLFHSGDKILLTGIFSSQTLSLGPNATGVSVNSYRTNLARTAVKIGAANAAVFADVMADGIDITASNPSFAVSPRKYFFAAGFP